MESFSFPRYLAAKRSVDDRALNPRVWAALAARLAARTGGAPLRVLEIGAGTGTMIARMAEGGLLDNAHVHALDAEEENIRAARAGLAQWGRARGCVVEDTAGGLRLSAEGFALEITLEAGDLFAFLPQHEGQPAWDLVVANAFLDLVDIPALLPRLRGLARPGGLFYFSINFDGVTALEPQVDARLDEEIMRLYHRSMDERITGGRLSGDSRAGRHLFQHLREAGYGILEAGSSDWLVWARGGVYPADEAYFLHCILHFFEHTLRGCPEIPAASLNTWLEARREQIRRGELVYMAHQLDFLAQVGEE